MMSVNGRNTVPASAAENPCTWMRAKGRKNNAPPRAAYRTSVNKLIALNVRDRNNSTGNIGLGFRASSQTKVPRSRTPVSSATRTIASHQAKDKAPERSKTKQRTAPIQTTFGVCIAALGYAVKGNPESWDCKQWINEKNPAPSEMIDNPAT